MSTTLTRLIQLGCLALLISCSRQDSDVVASGHLGATSGGSPGLRFGLSSPFFQEGDRMTIALLAEYPGRPMQAATLLLIRLTDGKSFATDGGCGDDSDVTYWHQKFVSIDGENVPVRYEMSHSPIAETITIGGQTYPLDDERVFLIDLTARPPMVTRLAEDLPALLPGTALGRDDLKKAVDTLRARHEAVEDLLGAR